MADTPLVIELSKQVLNYYDRLKNMSLDNSDTLVKHAFNEQKSLNMNWFRRINTLSDLLQSQSETRLNYPSQFRSRLRGGFETIWNQERQANRKLKFYNSFKCTFERESYIDIDLSYNELKRLSQFQMSSHKYSIETGRYGSKNGNILHRTCEHCTTEDKERVGLLFECPFFDPILEESSLHALGIPQQDWR